MPAQALAVHSPSNDRIRQVCMDAGASGLTMERPPFLALSIRILVSPRLSRRTTPQSHVDPAEFRSGPDDARSLTPPTLKPALATKSHAFQKLAETQHCVQRPVRKNAYNCAESQLKVFTPVAQVRF
jgi:hypothetical protein